MFFPSLWKRAYLPSTVLSCRIVIERINVDTVFLSFGVLSLLSFKEEYNIKVKKYATHIRSIRKIYMNILSHSCSFIDLDQKHFSQINAKMYFESENVIWENQLNQHLLNIFSCDYLYSISYKSYIVIRRFDFWQQETYEITIF